MSTSKKTSIGTLDSIFTVTNGVVSLDTSALFPIADSTAIVKNATDATKLVKLSAASLSTGVTRTLTMPDADVDLTSGTSANQLVRLTAASKLPAVDGSLLTNLPTGSTLPVTDTTAIAKNASDTTKQFRFALDNITTGTTRVITLPDADINLSSGTTANLLVRLDSSAKLPAVDGSQLTNVLPVTDSTSVVKNASDPTKLVKISAASLATGTTRTITVPNADVDLTSGTAADNLVRLDGSAKLPAVDGSQLTNLPGLTPFQHIRWSMEGNIYTTTFIHQKITTAGTIQAAGISCMACPDGASLLVDIRKNGNDSGNSIFLSDAPIAITSGQSASSAGDIYSTGTLDSGQTSLSVGDYLVATITQVGSNFPGADLNVVVNIS